MPRFDTHAHATPESWQEGGLSSADSRFFGIVARGTYIPSSRIHQIYMKPLRPYPANRQRHPVAFGGIRAGALLREAPLALCSAPQRCSRGPPIAPWGVQGRQIAFSSGFDRRYANEMAK